MPTDHLARTSTDVEHDGSRLRSRRYLLGQCLAAWILLLASASCANAEQPSPQQASSSRSTSSPDQSGLEHRTLRYSRANARGLYSTREPVLLTSGDFQTIDSFIFCGPGTFTLTVSLVAAGSDFELETVRTDAGDQIRLKPGAVQMAPPTATGSTFSATFMKLGSTAFNGQLAIRGRSLGDETQVGARTVEIAFFQQGETGQCGASP